MKLGIKKTIFSLSMVLIPFLAFPDEILLNSGKIITGKIDKVTDNSVIYVNADGKREVIRRDMVKDIFFDGPAKIKINEKKKQDTDPAYNAPLAGFHDSFLWIGISAGYSTITGELAKKEKKAYDIKNPSLVATYGYFDFRMLNYSVNWSVNLDLMAPSIKFPQKRWLDFTGIKFGVRGRYGYEVVFTDIIHGMFLEKIERAMDPTKVFTSGRLMTFKYWSAGPVINWIFNTNNRNLSFYINTYALFGTLIDGRLSTAPALRKTGIFYLDLMKIGDNHIYPLNYINYSSRVTGYTMRFGLGPHVSLDRWAPLTFGFNAIYCLTSVNLKRGVTTYYDWSKSISFSELGVEFSLGFHI
ncbi:MAG: YgdI/YgdR family lipoprotein [Spirochaetes bacterium]|jgi:hypothetical protein|nr:YgdI/YgdR family lipoprotein [Spirochaetota bacterium]